MVYQHYRTLLDSRCQEVYDALYHGIKKVETKIITPLVTQIELNKIYEFLVLDNPIFFYFKECSYTWTQKEMIFSHEKDAFQIEVTSCCVPVWSWCDSNGAYDLLFRSAAVLEPGSFPNCG